MSVLETPRIVFGGQISWDPIVTNNYTNEYNESTAQAGLDFNETAEQFRQDAASVDGIVNNGNWNPQGTHRSSFYDSSITSVDMGKGVDKNDPFVSCPALFQGMLVDCEPYGGVTSQLFFDDMSFGIEGGCRIYLPRTTRFTARYINFFRLPRLTYNFAASVASVVWQTSFPKTSSLQIDEHDSAALLALKTALNEDDVLGLTVRFNSYSTHYYGAETDSDLRKLARQLVKNIAGGGFQPNPARSAIVGVIGLWRKGEPAHEPGDRVMLTQCNPPPRSPPAPWAPTNFIATAYARLDSCSNQLTVDLSNSIPETDLAQMKQDFGTLAFSAAGTSGSPAPLGTIDYSQYNRDSYRDSAGIVTIQLDAAQATAAAKGTLQMTSEDGTKTYLIEQALRAIPSDPNLYINVGDNNVNTDVLVLNKGVPAGSGITVAMELDSPSVAQSTTAVTNADGIAAFSIQAEQGQVQGFMLTPHPDGSAGAINPQATTYMYIRTLADPALPQDPTWENVYNFILINWYAMAPCMDNWLDLNDEAQVRAYAPIIKKLTDPANFESFRFMPVTRDMTTGERALLYAFLDGGGAKSPALEGVEEEKPLSQAELSRQMRQA